MSIVHSTRYTVDRVSVRLCRTRSLSLRRARGLLMLGCRDKCDMMVIIAGDVEHSWLVWPENVSSRCSLHSDDDFAHLSLSL